MTETETERLSDEHARVALSALATSVAEVSEVDAIFYDPFDGTWNIRYEGKPRFSAYGHFPFDSSWDALRRFVTTANSLGYEVEKITASASDESSSGDDTLVDRHWHVSLVRDPE